MPLKFSLVSLLILLGVLSCLSAQNQLTVLSTNTNSGFEFVDEQGGSFRIIAGLNLPAAGRLLIGEGRSLQLIYGGRKIEITGPRDVSVTTLKEAASAQKSSTFLGRFWDFLSSSVTNTGNAQDVENYHRRYMTNTRAGIKGYVADDDEIWVPEYFKGSMSSEVVALRWEEIEGVTSYHLTVTGPDNDLPVLEVQTKVNHFDLPLAVLALREGETYRMEISAVAGETIVRTPELYFRYAPGVKEEFLKKLVDKRVVQTMTEIEKSLYFAQKLEEENLLEPALQYYQELLKATPDNQLIKKIYAAFLVRMNDPEKAKLILGV